MKYFNFILRFYFDSRLSQQAIKSLPADVVNKILNEALWSREEECLLADVDMVCNLLIILFN